MSRITLLLAAILMLHTTFSCAQKAEPWSSSQLMEPNVLAEKIQKNQAKDVLILCIGEDPVIKGSVDMGPAKEPENVATLKNYLKKVRKDKQIVIYCGCCPFARCPNIRPAFRAVQEMGFKNLYLLNLVKSIKANWIDQNYPTQD